MQIVHISDTHLLPFPDNMEPADLLIHSGDALNTGWHQELEEFKNQLLPVMNNYKKIILVPGNHDRCFQLNPINSIKYLKDAIPNIEILINDTIDFDGLRIHGNSWQPYFYNWAFNILNTDELSKRYEEIPLDVDILITHVPKSGTLDIVPWSPSSHCGSKELKKRMNKMTQLKVHLFGHIHYSRGIVIEDGITYSNGAICDESYKPIHKANNILI